MSRLLLVSALLLFAGSAHADEARGPIALAIHGGAGTIAKDSMTPAQEEAYRETLGKALDAGYAVLDEGGAAMDAVEAAIVIMEDSPLFNAGRGAVFTHDERNEMDASVMDGRTGQAGAVAGVTVARNPVRAALKVMRSSPHVLLSGAGADAFVRSSGLAVEAPAYFRTQKRLQQLRKAKKKDKVELDHGSEQGSVGPRDPNHKFGTVGAVALDQHGNLAAGTSTGGMTNKRWGRVGDSPIIGAGTWAENATAAVSCTGHGEFFIRQAAAHSVAARIRFGKESLKAAAAAVIHEQLKPIGGQGGLIAVDAKGEVALPYNTPGMYRGYRHSDGRREIAIWGK